MLLINPGSHTSGGTEEQARLNAEPFLTGIHKMGMPEVIIDPAPTYEDGRWIFIFRHPVTQKTATLSTHGLSADESRALFFMPRIYWNGCSVAEPKVSDFLPEKWSFRIVFTPPTIIELRFARTMSFQTKYVLIEGDDLPDDGQQWYCTYLVTAEPTEKALPEGYTNFYDSPRPGEVWRTHDGRIVEVVTVNPITN